MTEKRLPHDLETIEQALTGGPAPSPALRARVLARVDDELSRSARRPFRRYAAGVAAAVLLAMNVSLSLTTPAGPVADAPPARTAALAEQLRGMDLGLSEAEIARQCRLMAAGERLLPMGRPYGRTPDNMLEPF